MNKTLEFASHFLLPQDFDLAERTPVKKPTSSEIDAMQNSNLFEGDIIGVPVDEDPSTYLQKILRDQPMNDENTNFDEIFNRPVLIKILGFKFQQSFSVS